MRTTRRILTLLAVAAAATALAVGVGGCQKKEVVKPTPEVAPPAIRQAGMLLVGIDPSYPPFAGVDKGRTAGIDVDLASALAARLGLGVKLVTVKPSDMATALADGTADVVLSVPYTGQTLSQVSVAGSYIYDAPALFIATDSTRSVEPTLTLASLPETGVAAQKGSATYWLLVDQLGAEAVRPYDTLRDAMDALAAGEVRIVAGDALVGAYIARDMPKVHFAGLLADPSPLGAAVASDNTALNDAVRTALDGMAADGVLDAIRNKWVDGVRLRPKASADTSAASGF